MKALVTGGAGFIGSHIAEGLCRKGARVVVLDNLCLGSTENLAWKRGGDELDFVQGDVADALQKYAAEKYGQVFYHLYGLETVSFRYFNVFGARQSFDSPYSGVIAKFCTLMLEGKAPTILGDGKQSRDFVSIRNVVEANLLGAEAPGNMVAGRTFNIGTGSSINLLDLVDELNRQTGQDLTPNFGQARGGDAGNSHVDISAPRAQLGYEP